MEIVSISPASNGDNIHLMRGRSGPLQLGERIWVTFKETSTSSESQLRLVDFLSGHPDAQPTFKPAFKGALNSTTNEQEGFGVRVNVRTGEVNAGTNPNPQPLYNFTILVTLVANHNDSSSPRKRAYLRIHLHNYVAKAWLSPSRMRVPKNITGFSFSVFAQFDDQTIDRLSPSNVIDWFSDPPNKVDNNIGVMTLDNSDADESVINVRAVLTVEFKDSHGNQVEATGQAIAYTLPQIAYLIPNSAGYDRRDEVPNFLFLADGFHDASDQGKFNAMIDLFIRDLRQNDKFKPFDRLVGRMNFWKVFVPSAARGIGTKFEVFGTERAQPVPGAPTDFEIVNDSPTTENDLVLHQWGPNQLRHYFGLPVRSHMSLSNSDIKAYWAQISYLPASLINIVSNDFIDEWKSMGDRRMVSESDTFLGTYYGTPTKTKESSFEDRTTDKALFQMSDQRFNRTRLNQFLLNLQYRDENGALHPLGSIWDITYSSGASVPNGKDYDNIIVLLCASSGRAQNVFGQLYANVIDDERYYLRVEADTAANTGFSDGKAVKLADLDADRLPANMPLMPGKTTLLHEISHSLGLGDEYGEPRIAREDPRLTYTSPGGIESDKHFSNVQVKSDLVVSVGSNSIDADKVKWRWHRIAKSAVLAAVAPPAAAAITVNGSQYTIKVKPGQAAAFAVNDVVFLRRRKLGESILQDISYPQVSTPRYPFVTRSPALTVRSVNAGTDEVVVEPSDASALTGHDLVADFPAECVLYKPQSARTTPDVFPSAGALLELTAANVLSFMDRTGLPLHEKTDSHGQPDVDSDAEQSPDLGDTTVSLCAKKNRDVVGLYAGGFTYHHGVYHPTGHCIMRDNHQVAEFCSVCKYILTDFIDPSLHPQVDVLIEEYYPIKANH